MKHNSYLAPRNDPIYIKLIQAAQKSVDDAMDLLEDALKKMPDGYNKLRFLIDALNLLKGAAASYSSTQSEAMLNLKQKLDQPFRQREMKNLFFTIFLPTTLRQITPAQFKADLFKCLELIFRPAIEGEVEAKQAIEAAAEEARKADEDSKKAWGDYLKYHQQFQAVRGEPRRIPSEDEQIKEAELKGEYEALNSKADTCAKEVDRLKREYIQNFGRNSVRAYHYR